MEPTSEERFESKEIQTKKYVQKVHLKTSCNKSLGRLKESRKILFDGRTVLLGSGLIKIYLSLYFPFNIFMTILHF
jgi:hypothetical protein